VAQGRRMEFARPSFRVVTAPSLQSEGSVTFLVVANAAAAARGRMGAGQSNRLGSIAQSMSASAASAVLCATASRSRVLRATTCSSSRTTHRRFVSSTTPTSISLPSNGRLSRSRRLPRLTSPFPIKIARATVALSATASLAENRHTATVRTQTSAPTEALCSRAAPEK
jgi:hypothetical protein